MGVLVRELAALYAAFRDGQPSPLPELPVQYADFARLAAAAGCRARSWRRSSATGGEQLAGAPAAAGAADRPAAPGGADAPRRRAARSRLPRSCRRRCASSAGARGRRSSWLLLAASRRCSRRHAGQEDVVVGTPVAGRSRPEIEGLIGFFVNTLVLRARPRGRARPSASCSAGCATAALEAFAHQDLPFERLVEELQPEREPGRTPLFQVLFDLQNCPAGALALPGLRCEPVAGRSRTGASSTSPSTPASGRAASAAAWCTTPTCSTARRSSAAAPVRGAAGGGGRRPRTRGGELPLLGRRRRGAAARSRCARWSAAGRGLPSTSARAQAPRGSGRGGGRRPARGDVWTYGELDGARRPARPRPAGAGVGPEVRVAVCARRSPSLVVAAARRAQGRRGLRAPRPGLSARSAWLDLAVGRPEALASSPKRRRRPRRVAAALPGSGPGPGGADGFPRRLRARAAESPSGRTRWPT